MSDLDNRSVSKWNTGLLRLREENPAMKMRNLVQEARTGNRLLVQMYEDRWADVESEIQTYLKQQKEIQLVVRSAQLRREVLAPHVRASLSKARDTLWKKAPEVMNGISWHNLSKEVIDGGFNSKTVTQLSQWNAMSSSYRWYDHLIQAFFTIFMLFLDICVIVYNIMLIRFILKVVIGGGIFDKMKDKLQERKSKEEVERVLKEALSKELRPVYQEIVVLRTLDLLSKADGAEDPTQPIADKYFTVSFAVPKMTVRSYKPGAPPVCRDWWILPDQMLEQTVRVEAREVAEDLVKRASAAMLEATFEVYTLAVQTKYRQNTGKTLDMSKEVMNSMQEAFVSGVHEKCAEKKLSIHAEIRKPVMAFLEDPLQKFFSLLRSMNKTPATAPASKGGKRTRRKTKMTKKSRAQ